MGHKSYETGASSQILESLIPSPICSCVLAIKTNFFHALNHLGYSLNPNNFHVPSQNLIILY